MRYKWKSRSRTWHEHISTHKRASGRCLWQVYLSLFLCSFHKLIREHISLRCEEFIIMHVDATPNSKINRIITAIVQFAVNWFHNFDNLHIQRVSSLPRPARAERFRHNNMKLAASWSPPQIIQIIFDRYINLIIKGISVMPKMRWNQELISIHIFSWEFFWISRAEENKNRS